MSEAPIIRLVFVDGFYVAAESTPLEELGLALERLEGNGLRLSLHKTLDTPLLLLHRSQGASIALSQLQLHLAPGVHATVREHFLPMSVPTGGWQGVTEVVLEERAHCEYLHLQEPIAGTWEHDVSVLQAAHSTWKAQTFLTGAGSHRVDFHMEQNGIHAEATLLGSFLGQSTQSVHISSTAVHAVPETRSRQLVKGIASDHARCSFRGMVHVLPHAKNAFGKMHNHNLLLDPTAEVQTMPCFQIDHDQVVCNHGATVGQLRADELFYLQARGIPPAKSELLLSRAFIEETTADIIQNPEMGPAITAYIDRFFANRATMTKETAL